MPRRAGFLAGASVRGAARRFLPLAGGRQRDEKRDGGEEDKEARGGAAELEAVM